MEVILYAYTTEQCPVVPFDAEQAAHVGERWKHIETIEINYQNVVHRVMRLESRTPTYPLPTGLEWPEKYAKIAFTGQAVEEVNADLPQDICYAVQDNSTGEDDTDYESAALVGEPDYGPSEDLQESAQEETRDMDFGGGDGGGGGASGEY